MLPAPAPFALVVEDDPFILMGACDILEAAGFRFYEADNGDDAKTLLEEHARDVVLLFSDVDMPGDTNGFALARHVAVHWPWIEIVIASGRHTPRQGDLPDRATFLRKPFTSQSVHDHLRHTLPDRKQPDSLRSDR